MANTIYRVTIIGTGRMGGLMEDEQPFTNQFSKPYGHFSAYQAIDQTEVVAVANRGADRMAHFAQRFGIDKTYLDYREMIQKERPDIVSVTTPSLARAEPIIFAAENGVRGIYSEKGLCASLEEADRVAEACRRNKVAFNWGAMRRHHDGYKRLRHAIARGDIGQPLFATMYQYTDLIKHHPHTLDVVQMLLGDSAPVWVEGHLIEKGEPLDPGDTRMGPRDGKTLQKRLPMPIPDDNPLTHAGVSLGRRLFYDVRLSGDDTVACGTCHQQERAFTDGRVVSEGVQGRKGTRNAMSLVNLAWTAPYFWDGRAPTLEALVPIPIGDPNEMDQDMGALVEELAADPDYVEHFATAFPDEGLTEKTVARALAQFLRILVSFDSGFDHIEERELAGREMRGEMLLRSGMPKGDPEAVVDFCNACHRQSHGIREGARGTGTFSLDEQRVNGIERGPSDPARFDVPTVRNIAVTGPYMHDGRFSDLAAVVTHYDQQVRAVEGLEHPLLLRGEPVRLNLDAADRDGLVAVFELLTDPVFLHEPVFADPGSSR